MTAVGALRPDAQARPHRQIRQVVALAAVARRGGEHVHLHAALDDAREPAGRGHEHARAPRGDHGARIVARVEDAVEAGQLVPVQRVVDGRVSVRPVQQDRALAARLGQRRDAVLGLGAARDAQVAAVPRSTRSDSVGRGVVAERRDEARLGAERRQRAGGHAPASRRLLERVVQLHDRAALERLVQARVLHPLDVADDRDARSRGCYFDRAPSPSSESTARNASWGTSTVPMIFMRFLPFFCFSSSLRLRVTSPP